MSCAALLIAMVQAKTRGLQGKGGKIAQSLNTKPTSAAGETDREDRPLVVRPYFAFATFPDIFGSGTDLPRSWRG
jgi:hypothetical protein